jgi:hypothetical protein
MKKEVSFFREKRKNPISDVAKFLQNIGLSDSQITEDILTIYNVDGTTTKVEHPFDALKQCKEHNEARR